MGKTVESFGMALEGEINRWCGFVTALRKDDWEGLPVWKCVELLGLDERIIKKVIDLIIEAGNEFSCLACP